MLSVRSIFNADCSEGCLFLSCNWIKGVEYVRETVLSGGENCFPVVHVGTHTSLKGLCLCA